MAQRPVFCGKDCGGDACPLLATVEDGRVVGIVHNPEGDGYAKACSKGMDLALETYAPDRILEPLVRKGPRGSGDFRPVSWNEALDIVASRLSDIRSRFGAESVLNLSSAGSIGAVHSTS
ncbi:MAG: molybdopterin-dependent oxidoreductase, partial [Rectinemataceae bacterium]|nr:molybdopterin-dependent oxidoreductase [Rectinemataceae bacterium]